MRAPNEEAARPIDPVVSVPTESASSESEMLVELTEEDLEHVVGGLERAYIYSPQTSPGPDAV